MAAITTYPPRNCDTDDDAPIHDFSQVGPRMASLAQLEQRLHAVEAAISINGIEAENPALFDAASDEASLSHSIDKVTEVLRDARRAF